MPVKFVFEGEFIVEADSAADAREIVGNDCHLVMGQCIQSDADEVKKTGTFTCTRRNSSAGSHEMSGAYE